MAFSAGMYLTNAGRMVQAAAQAGAQLHFTRLEMGDGHLGGQLEIERTALISPKQSLSLTSLRINTDGTATVGAAFHGSTVGSFYDRERGLWVQDPNNSEAEILYGYANAGDGAQSIPAAGSAEIIEKTINVIMSIGNASNVTAEIVSGLYASAADLDAHIGDTDNPHNITREQIGAAAANDVTALQAVNAPLTTGGTAPAFTLTPDPAIDAYADGQTWTVRFHASAENPTLDVSGLGAAAILEATGKAAKAKAGQIARVMRYGANFFTVSAGGGVALPDTIVAGDTLMHYIEGNPFISISTNESNAFLNAPVGWGFIAIKDGTYRVSYLGQSSSTSYEAGMRLYKNGNSEVPNSLVWVNNSLVIKTIDISLVAGDTIKFQGRGTYSMGAYRSSLHAHRFKVSILATEIQSEFAKIVTPY